MNADNHFAKDISLQLSRLERQILKSVEIQRSFIIMAFEFLQQKMPFADQKEFDEWLDTMTKLQKPF